VLRLLAAAAVSLALLLPFGKPADAQVLGYGRLGPYVGLGWSKAFEEFDDPGNGQWMDADDSWGINGRAGIRFHSNVSVEVEFERFDNFDADNGNALHTPWMLSANLKGYFLTGRFQPFGLLSGGIFHGEIQGCDIPPDGVCTDKQQQDSSEAQFAWKFGGGIDTYATENLVISLEASYLLPTGKLDDYPFWMTGVVFEYRF
jgi:opacity protein-like surface antigen